MYTPVCICASMHACLWAVLLIDLTRINNPEVGVVYLINRISLTLRDLVYYSNNKIFIGGLFWGVDGNCCVIRWREPRVCWAFYHCVLVSLMYLEPGALSSLKDFVTLVWHCTLVNTATGWKCNVLDTMKSQSMNWKDLLQSSLVFSQCFKK